MNLLLKKATGITLIELLVVLFILTTVAFVSFPNFWNTINQKDNITIGNYLKSLREDAITTKNSTVFEINFKERFFLFKGNKGEKVLKMNENEVWELYLPSKGLIKDGQVKVIFPPTISEEFLLLYLSQDKKDFTITLNNLTGEVEVAEGKQDFNTQ